MKILYILDKPNLYGSELHVLDLVEQFSEDNQVLVVTFDHGPLISRIETLGVRVIVSKLPWLPTLGSLKQLLKIIKQFNPDIVHSHQPKATLWGSICAFILRKRRVITIHSSPGDTSRLRTSKATAFSVLLFHRFVQLVSELVTNKSIFVSANSQRKSFLKDKSVVVHNWLNNLPAMPNSVKSGSGKIQLLYIGSISYAKGLDLLLEFCTKLDKKKFKLSIVGDGEVEYMSTMKTKFNQIDLEVNFHGYQSHTLPFYQNADVFISLSRSETFGLSFAEAASYGLPIFARDLEVLREILPPENFFSDNLDELVAKLYLLVDDDKLCQTIANRNFNWAQTKFNRATNARKISNLYLQIQR